MENNAPSWANPENLREKPDSGAFGFIDDKGSEFGVSDLGKLLVEVEASRAGVQFVWTPEFARVRIPEEVSELDEVFWLRAQSRAKRDCSDGLRMGALFGVVVLWTLLWGWQRYQGDIESIISYPSVGISLLLLFIFGFYPWYEGQKLLKQGRLKELQRDEAVAEAKFELWLEKQSIVATRFLLSLLVIVGLVQLWSAFFADSNFIEAGALKPSLEWWRYWTSAFLHGNVLHWVMNASGLLFLARRVEVLARWPHLLGAYSLSLFIGALSSVWWNPEQPTVGASGAILGLLGFLLVFESRHQSLVPKPARKRLLAGLCMTILMGVFGFSFIDNAAHAGGLVAGAFYAMIVFPVTDSVRRNQVTGKEVFIGGGFALLLILAMSLTLFRLLS